ncbi:endonuclease/exonuclease/phosphatase family protein [Maribacter algarum]|uniref:Endonuclease/exonuclease/phosphatase family protein n=2 Tax=Maribacter algarum (ex Zhang et al. 2020) TaxID=2578118 RepID=A0A5S3PS32_9FLAO|nr:endonuclease/exonuclease/phosphatase family protein [Maribacter algarum]
MTYNIKYDNVNDTVNNWNDRKAAMVDLIKGYNPEFLGLQEVLFRQLEYLDNSLINHRYIGVGRDDGKQKGEFSPILFDEKKFRLLDSNTFWLSKTPNKISVGWDASMERICTYGLFENRVSKAKVWVFNTHFDHIGVKARKNSAKLILKEIKQLNIEKLPLILMGDFNLMPEEKPIRLFQKKMDDAQHISKTTHKSPKGTFNNFDINNPMERRIDYIFTKNLKVNSYIHIDKRLASGKHISDHLPVLVSLSKK